MHRVDRAHLRSLIRLSKPCCSLRSSIRLSKRVEIQLVNGLNTPTRGVTASVEAATGWIHSSQRIELNVLTMQQRLFLLRTPSASLHWMPAAHTTECTCNTEMPAAHTTPYSKSSQRSCNYTGCTALCSSGQGPDQPSTFKITAERESRAALTCAVWW